MTAPKAAKAAPKAPQKAKGSFASFLRKYGDELATVTGIVGTIISLSSIEPQTKKALQASLDALNSASERVKTKASEAETFGVTADDIREAVAPMIEEMIAQRVGVLAKPLEGGQ